MIRHQGFFEELASLDEDSAEWRAAAAGLVVLRLIDAWIEGDIEASNSWSVRNVVSAIADIDEGSTLRTMLNRVLESVRTSSGDIHRAVPPLMAYGQALEYEAKWHLATDVYQTLLAHLHPVEDAHAVAAAYIRLGTCYRNLNQIDASASAFAAASDVSTGSGDMDGILRARIGEARVAILRGNYPHAERILDETIANADRPDLLDVRSRALQDRSEVAQVRGDFELGIQLAYEAMRTSQSAKERDRILNDIGTAFLNLGVYSAARDAFLIVSVTSPEQYVRWAAMINLLDVAAATGAQVLFEEQHRQLAAIALPAALSAQFEYSLGDGYYRLDNRDAAQSHLARASAIANEHGLRRVSFMAEETLERVLAAPAVRLTARPLPLDLTEVATAIGRRREEVGA